MDCKNCYELITLIVAVLTLVCNGIMIYIMEKELRKDIKNLQNRFENVLERAKKKLIYEPFFPQGEKPNDFESRVSSAYIDIKKLIPTTNDNYQQEDWLLAEWLVQKRGYGDESLNDEHERIKKLAEEISRIRRNR